MNQSTRSLRSIRWLLGLFIAGLVAAFAVCRQRAAPRATAWLAIVAALARGGGLADLLSGSSLFSVEWAGTVDSLRV